MKNPKPIAHLAALSSTIAALERASLDVHKAARAFSRARERRREAERAMLEASRRARKAGAL